MTDSICVNVSGIPQSGMMQSNGIQQPSLGMAAGMRPPQGMHQPVMQPSAGMSPPGVQAPLGGQQFGQAMRAPFGLPQQPQQPPPQQFAQQNFAQPSMMRPPAPQQIGQQASLSSQLQASLNAQLGNFAAQMGGGCASRPLGPGLNGGCGMSGLASQITGQASQMAAQAGQLGSQVQTGLLPPPPAQIRGSAPMGAGFVQQQQQQFPQQFPLQQQFQQPLPQQPQAPLFQNPQQQYYTQHLQGYF